MFLWKLDHTEVPFAIRREAAIHQQCRPTILEVVTLFSQPGDPPVVRTYPVNLLANILRIFPGEARLRASTIDHPRHQHGNLPLILGLRNAWPGNLRTVNNAPLRARL